MMLSMIEVMVFIIREGVEYGKMAPVVGGLILFAGEETRITISSLG